MQSPDAIARRNVRLFYAFVSVMDFTLWAGIWIKYLTVGNGLELKWILAMDFPFWILVALLNAPLGALADHVGRKPILIAAALAFSATIIGFGFTTNYWLLFADYILWAFAQAMRSGADQALVYDSLKAAGRESDFKRVAGRAYAFVLLSGLAGIILGGFLAAATSLAFTVRLSGLVPLAGAVIVLFMREPRGEHVERHYWADLRSGFRYSWQHPQLRYILLLGSMLLTAGFVPVVVVQPFLIHYNVPTELFGVYQAPLRIATVLAAVVAYRLTRLVGVPTILALAGAGMVIAYGGLGLVDAKVAFAFFLIPALLQGLMRPTVDNYINERTPSQSRATVLSVYSLFFGLQVALFEPALGFVIDGVSIQAAGAFSAAAFAILLPPLTFLWWRAHRTATHPALEPAEAPA